LVLCLLAFFFDAKLPLMRPCFPWITVCFTVFARAVLSAFLARADLETAFPLPSPLLFFFWILGCLFGDSPSFFRCLRGVLLRPGALRFFHAILPGRTSARSNVVFCHASPLPSLTFPKVARLRPFFSSPDFLGVLRFSQPSYAGELRRIFPNCRRF